MKLTNTIILLILSFFTLINAQITYTWNGSVSSNWTNGNNWTPVGPPLASDHVILVTAPNAPSLSANTTVSNVTQNSGTLNLGTFNLTVAGLGTFNNGTINGTGTLNCIGSQTTFGIVASGPTINTPVTVNSANIFTRKTTYNSTVVFTKNDGTSSNNSNGGNVFNSTFTINYISTFGTGYISMGNGTADIYNGDVFANNNSLDRIIFAHNSIGNQFNGNLILTQIGSSLGTAMTWGPGTASIAAGKTISFGGIGYNTGFLYTENLTQLGTTPITLTQTGTASIYLGPNATFNSPITVTSPSIYVRGTTFNNSTVLNKNGATPDHNNNQKNIFNGDLTINNSGLGYFMLGYNSNDLFNSNVTLTCTNTGGISLGYVNGTGTPTLAAGKMISIGAAGFNQGYLRLGEGFKQTTNEAINLDLTGASFYINSATVNPEFNGPLTVKANDLYIEGGIFNGPVNFTKLGSISNHNSGRKNIFNNTLQINQQGTGYFMLGYNSNDLFNDNITVNSSNTGVIYFGWSSGTGTPTLAAGKTISVGGTGFSTGGLYFGGFTQLGNVPITLNLGTNTSIGYRDCNFGGNVTSSSGRLFFNGNTFNGTASLTKTSGVDDMSIGGNIFKSTSIIENGGTGYLGTGNGAPDIFNSDLTLINSGTNVIYFGFSSTGNIIDGNFTIQNTGGSQTRILDNNSTLSVNGSTSISTSGSGVSSNVFYPLYGSLTQTGNIVANNSTSGANGFIIISNTAGSVLNLTGNLTINNTSSSANNGNSIGVGGNVSISGNLVANNNSTGNTSNFYLAQSATSTVSVAGTSYISNNGAGTTKNVYLGDYGSITFASDLTIENNASATNSLVYCNNYTSATSTYNGNIVITNTNVTGQGIRFGLNGGNGTLAATKTITIGAGGFVNGEIRFKNFTQIGPTAQTLHPTGVTIFHNSNSNWGGNVSFKGSRMYTEGTVYQGTSYLEKYGISIDVCPGGNTFVGNCELRNSGSDYLLMGNTLPDVWSGNLIMNNTGTANMYLAHNSAGNSIAGNLTLNNTTSGTTGDVYFTSTTGASLAISGNVILNNTSTATNSNTYFGHGNLTTSTIGGNVTMINNSTSVNAAMCLGNSGSVSVGGSVTGNNIGTSTSSHIYMANGTNSIVTISGNAIFKNDGFGITRRMFLGNYGKMTFNGTLTLDNSSSATNSEIYLNNYASSINDYNQNIVITNSDAAGDGIRFGENGGFGTLAATKTITIGAGGFVAGELRFRNFTQVGPTAHTLITTGTTFFDNYNSNWGGNVYFTGARMFTRGTTYNGTSYLEKFGANNDASTGGNTFVGNSELKNSGSGYFMMGNGLPDTWGANLIMNNTGTHWMYLAHSSAGNSIAGNLTINNLGTGVDNSIYLINSATSTLNVAGNLSITNAGNSTNAAVVIYGDAGNGTVGGNVTLLNNSPASSTNLYLGNIGGIDVTGNVTATNTSTGTSSLISLANSGTGLSTYGGNLVITNNPSGSTSNIYLANAATRALKINGTTTLNNIGGGTTKRFWVGNSGDVTFNNDLIINNSSSATNSEIFANYNTASENFYNGNIIVSNSNVLGDGVFFGNSNGIGTLAATKTVTIGAGGFVGGELRFRNFTQVGPTAQTLHPTGATLFENYNSNWGGDVSFKAARMFTRGTTYNGTSYLEKSGALDDASVGGNIFKGNCELRNSGSRYFLMGNGLPDIWNNNLIMNNTGTFTMHLAYNSAGNSIDGNLTLNNTGAGADNSVYFCSTAASSLSVGGNVTLNNLVSGTGANIIFPETGTASVAGNLTGINNGSGANSQIILSHNTTTALSVNGTTNLTNSGGGTTKRTYIGNTGDIIFNGDLTISNTSSATNSEVYANHSTASVVAYNGNIKLTNTNVLSDGIFFGNANGSGTLAATKTVTIGAAGFTSGYLQFRNFTQVGPTPQAITVTGLATTLENNTSNWGGEVTFIAPKHLTSNTTYNGVSFIEKNGAGNDVSLGGNTFNKDVTLLVSGTGNFMPSNTVGNDFNANVTYSKTNVGLMYPSYSATSTYAGDISINSNTVITFGEFTNGVILFDGAGIQNINNLGAATNHIIRRITTNKSGGFVKLNTPIINNTTLNLIAGNIETDATNLLTMLAGSNVIAVSDAAYISGPIRKVGNTAFTFPIGKGGFYRPAGISAPTTATHHFTAEYFNADPHNSGYLDTQLDPTIQHVSDCEYWMINRTFGTSNVAVTLSFKPYTGGGCSGVTNPSTLKVARWNGTQWKDHGNGGTTGATSGTIVTSGAVTAFSPFTLATNDLVNNPLPIELINFNAQLNGDVVDVSWQTASEINNDYFDVERSADGSNFESVTTLKGAGNSTSLLSYTTVDENPYYGLSFYRLKQVDLDGAFTYSQVVAIQLESNGVVLIYPNPVVRNQNHFTIDLTNVKEPIENITITDELGRVVFVTNKVANEKIIIFTESFNSGLYLITTKTNTKNNISKIIIN